MLSLEQVNSLIGKHPRKKGEYPIATLRRLMMKGKVTREQILRVHGFGPKGYRNLLGLLGIKEGNGYGAV